MPSLCLLAARTAGQARRPSAERRAYLLDRDNFLAGLRVCARRLAEDGYTLAPTETPYQFRMFREGDERKKPLLVDPVAMVCSCAFHRRQAEVEPLTPDGSLVPCRHLLGLTDLIESTLASLRARDDTRAYYPLAAHWAATRDALRRDGRPVVLSRMNRQKGRDDERNGGARPRDGGRAHQVGPDG